MTELTPADQEIMRLATEADDAPEAKQEAPEAKAEEAQDDTLELGSEEAPKATEEEIAAEEKRKGRSHSPIQRINTLTAKLREAERRAAELEARVAPQQDNSPQAPNPDDPKYEFGMADPQYIKDSALFEVRKELADERKRADETSKAATAQQEVISKISDGMANIEKTGTEKYDDFEAKISEAVEARGGEPLPPLVSIGIAVSPAGADVAYHLATNEADQAKLENLAKTSPQAAAVAFGEIEGQYLDGDDDLNLADPMDMARMLGRMKSRLAGKKAGTVERKMSKAPEPPENRARGSSGKFEVGDDTDDFRAFERKYSRG